MKQLIIDILKTEIIFFQNIGPDYLHRFRLIPMIVFRGEQWHPPRNVFIHRFLRSDHDRALHDHPWESWSLLIWGDLVEFYYYASEHNREWLVPLYQVGRHYHRRIPKFKWIHRPATWRHRLIVDPEATRKPITIFVTGPKVRDWGFWPAGVWVYWKTYLGIQ